MGEAAGAWPQPNRGVLPPGPRPCFVSRDCPVERACFYWLKSHCAANRRSRRIDRRACTGTAVTATASTGTGVTRTANTETTNTETAGTETAGTETASTETTSTATASTETASTETESDTMMISARTAAAVVAVAIGIAAAPAWSPADAAPPPQALVIGNGTYVSLPALSACLPSAHAVAAALRGAGFNVVEREDMTSGGIDAAIGEAGRQFAANPGAPAFVYICTYATSFNDRAFLLPTSANIARPGDVLTQGVLAKSLVELLTRGGERPALLALDVVPAPSAAASGAAASGASPAGGAVGGPVGAPGGGLVGGPSSLGLNGLMPATPPPGLGFIAASQSLPPEGPTPLAAALAVDLKAATVEVASLLGTLRQQLGVSKAVAIAALHQPGESAILIGAPAPPPPPQAASVPAASVPAAAAPPTVAAAAAPPAAATSATSPAAIPATSSAATSATSQPPARLPDEVAMTEADRRRVQTALARLGYYDGKVDGVFGPDTRAAIRRFQHELGADMHGRLTADQASKLVAGR